MTVTIEGATRIEVNGAQVWPSINGPDDTPPTPDPTPVPHADYIAHRGAALNHPENTQQGFDWSTAAGYPIELDLVQLEDGHFAVIHDTTLDRTTNGSGPVSAVTRSQWLALTCDVTAGVDGVTMTFDQVLDRYGKTARYFAELKQGSVADLVALLDSYPWARDRVALMSFDRATCSLFGQSGYGTCYLTGTQSGASANPPESLLADGIAAIAISRYGSGVTHATYAPYLDAGMTALAWTVDDRSLAQSLVAAGIGVISDRPDYVSTTPPPPPASPPQEAGEPVKLSYNGISNSLGAAHNDSTTTLTLASKLTYVGGDVPTIASPDYLMLSILDSDGLCAEVVKVTAYTSGATSATIERGQEDTTGVAHDNGATVIHGPTAAAASPLEFISAGSLSSSGATLGEITLPPGYLGFRIIIEAQSTDTGGTSDYLGMRVKVGGSFKDGANTYQYGGGTLGATNNTGQGTFAFLTNIPNRNNALDWGYTVLEIGSGYDDAAKYTRWHASGGHADTTGRWTAIASGTYVVAEAVEALGFAPCDAGFANASYGLRTGSTYRLYGYTA